jgi:alpha-glucosidase
MTWWRDTIFYEIYIRSFQDGNDDGIGDLDGITARLGYLEDLGVGGIWITPFYPSPQVDFGYDVANHEDVDPQFGTLAAFDRLIGAAHARGIRVIVDVVLNHTSDRHPWFVASRSSRASTHRDWYIWRDGAAPGRPPNNWESAFGGPAWTFDALTGQWFYHFFYSAQPDLNWRNPAVEARLFQTLKFWLDRGVDGFRLDAVNALFEDPALRDNPVLPEPRITLTGIRTQDFVHTRSLPEMHDVLRRLRTFVDRHSVSALLISEAYVDTVGELVRFYGNGAEMHLPFNFFLAQVPALNAAAFARAVDDFEAACGSLWPSLVLSNHDIDRACDRYATDASVDADDVARLLAVMLLTLRGTPFIYYGEEIAMRTEPPATIDEVRDPVGRTFWPRYKGRDGVRRPMAWDAGAGAGFSRGAPWLPLARDAAVRNVASQSGDPRAPLNVYRAMTRLRREHVALRDGSYRALCRGPHVFGFERTSGAASMVVCLNMTAAEQTIALDRADGDCCVIFSTHRPASHTVDMTSIRLAPFEAMVLAARL